jgi:hypothetical protein
MPTQGPKPLHPNLARLAAGYDEIFGRYAHNQISAAQAQAEIATLIARDDEGTEWGLDPTNGSWRRRTVAGNWVNDEPPTYGLATPTPHDVSPGTAFNPNQHIEMNRVSDEMLYAPNQFAGATRAPRQYIPDPYDSWWRRLLDRVSALFRR